MTGRDRASARIRRRAASARYIETHVALWRNSAIENAAGIRDETEAFNVLNDAACEAAEAIPCWLEPVLNWRASRRLDHDEAGEDVVDGPAVAALARQVTVLGDYVAGVLASGGQLASHRHALEHVAGELASLGALLAADPEAIEAGAGDELEPYCRACGHWIGYFLGLDGWQHYRGEPAPGGRRTLYDAGHEADPAWCVPPGRSLAPADLAVVRDALADGHASQWHRGEPGAAERADAYSALLGRLAAEAAG